ncbi:MAG TPA: hypothetical protein VKE53_06950 [Pseudolabrys sp.]|nr:hypothetical protein [Pseudolabrys sp.]
MTSANLRLRGRIATARITSVIGLALIFCRPTFADEMVSPRHHHHHYLSTQHHVVEVVQPPYSGVFITNGFRFIGMTPTCRSWVPGEPIRLISGSWYGYCVTATFYNVLRHNTCQTQCGGAAYY